MFTCLCKRLLPKWRVVRDSARIRLGFVQAPLLPIKPFSSSSSSKSVKDELRQSFTVSYLRNSCGLPLETAISASQKVQFETAGRPDSVLTLLRDHGFTNTQITKFVRTLPRLLVADPQKTVLPKLEFFRSSIGVSSTDLARILSLNPYILERSLKNRIMPWYNFLKSLPLDDKKIVKVMTNSPWICGSDLQKTFASNISALRELGVPESLVLLTVTCYTSLVVQNHDKFDNIVKGIVEMGYNPKKTEFIHAVLAFSGSSQSTREHKIKIYRRWGLSEDDVQLVFKKRPLSMNLSEKKIMGVMDFLVNKMGCQPAAIARYPLVLQFSLDKRIIPRCLVIKVLMLKDLIKKDLSLGTFLILNDKNFQDKFVSKYEEDVPQLLNVYRGKMNLLELGFGSEEICRMKQL